jgi:hypothetical protein
MLTRREFVIGMLPISVLALTYSRVASGQAAKLEETDPTAVALGYKHNASTVDTSKFPAYVAGRNCAGCQLFQGKEGDVWGSCSAFGGKLVNASGWCGAWVKKA